SQAWRPRNTFLRGTTEYHSDFGAARRCEMREPISSRPLISIRSRGMAGRQLWRKSNWPVDKLGEHVVKKTLAEQCRSYNVSVDVQQATCDQTVDLRSYQLPGQTGTGGEQLAIKSRVEPQCIHHELERQRFHSHGFEMAFALTAALQIILRQPCFMRAHDCAVWVRDFAVCASTDADVVAELPVIQIVFRCAPR